MLFLVGGAVPALIIQQVISHNRVNANSSKECATCFGNAEEKDRGGDANGSVDAIFDGSEDGDYDTDKENDSVQWRNSPKLVDGIGGSDEITDGVDDDSSQSSAWNVPKKSRKSVDGQKHHDGGDATGQGSTSTGLCLDGGTGEGTGSWIGTEERTEKIANTDADEFLGRINGVIVDTAK